MRTQYYERLEMGCSDSHHSGTQDPILTPRTRIPVHIGKLFLPNKYELVKFFFILLVVVGMSCFVKHLFKEFVLFFINTLIWVGDALLMYSCATKLVSHIFNAWFLTVYSEKYRTHM